MRRWVAAASLGLTGCAGSGTPPADLFVPPSAAASQARERRFEGVPAEQLSQAAVQVLQDANFLVTASEPALGLIVGARGATLKSINQAGAELRSGLPTRSRSGWRATSLNRSGIFPGALAPPFASRPPRPCESPSTAS